MVGASRAGALKGTLAKLRRRKVYAALLACAVVAATAAVLLLLGSHPPPVEVEVIGYLQEGTWVNVATVNETLRIVLRLRGVEEAGSSGTLWILVVQARPGNYDQPVHLAWFPVNLLPNETKVVWTEFTPPNPTDGENISEYYIKFYWNWETRPFKEVHGLFVKEGEK